MNEEHEYQAQEKEDWTTEIEKIETFLSETELPKKPLQLTMCENITDLNVFFQSHIATAKAKNGHRMFKPYLNRMIEAVTLLKK